MVDNTFNNNDMLVIEFFQKQIEWRKSKEDKDLWLGDLLNICTAMLPHLAISESAKQYLEHIVKDVKYNP